MFRQFFLLTTSFAVAGKPTLVFIAGILVGVAAFKRNTEEQRAAARNFMGGKLDGGGQRTRIWWSRETDRVH